MQNSLIIVRYHFRSLIHCERNQKMNIKHRILFLLIIFLSFNISATLEDRLSTSWLLKNLDVYSFQDFQDFLGPNEFNPNQIKLHLDLITKNGLLVASGTERSFIALTLCQKCTGLVGVDINPRVKAYNDFNTLLLRLSKNRQDYLSLRAVDSARQGKNIEIDKMVIMIKEKIITDTEIKGTLKDYYLSNIDNFAKIFYEAQLHSQMFVFIDSPNNQLFKEANYLYEDELFNRLQKFAKNGDMVFTIADINNLNFLNKEQIVAIDTSNIYQYVPLNYENDPKLTNDKVRVIWVKGQQRKTEFYSYIPILKKDEDDKLINYYSELIINWYKEKVDQQLTPALLKMQISEQLASEKNTDVAPQNSSAHHVLKILKKIFSMLQT